MSDRSYEESRMKELKAILDNIRFECSDLVDDYFVTFVESGRPWQEWLTVSQYERKLFQAANNERMTFEERRGALKLIRAYLKSVIGDLKREGFKGRDLLRD